MILYISCMCGRNKLLYKQYRNQDYEVRVANMNPEHRKEAKGFGLRMPFIVVDGKASNV